MYLYTSDNPLFKSLTKEEVATFEEHAFLHFPGPRSFGVFHPVCRDVWKQLGINESVEDRQKLHALANKVYSCMDACNPIPLAGLLHEVTKGLSRLGLGTDGITHHPFVYCLLDKLASLGDTGLLSRMDFVGANRFKAWNPTMIRMIRFVATLAETDPTDPEGAERS